MKRLYAAVLAAAAIALTCVSVYAYVLDDSADPRHTTAFR